MREGLADETASPFDVSKRSHLPVMFHKIDYPFLIGAFVSFLASVSLWFLKSHEYGLFVGLWVPSILSLWVGVRVAILGLGISTRKVL